MAHRQFETICHRNPGGAEGRVVVRLEAVMRAVTFIFMLLISPALP